MTDGALVRDSVRKARIPDVQGLKGLVDEGAQSGALLPRTVAELCESLRDFYIYVDAAGVSGCCALHIDTQNLAEVRTLIVREELRGQGIGRKLVEICLEEACALGIERVYALTRTPEFFRRLGFLEIDKHDLPSKVFRDCVRCPLFPDCDEVAMAQDVGANPDGLDSQNKENGP